MSDIDAEKWDKWQGLVSADEHPSAAFCEALGLTQDIVHAELDAVTRVAPMLEGVAFWRPRQTVYYQCKCIKWLDLSVVDMRALVHVLQLCACQDLGRLATSYTTVAELMTVNVASEVVITLPGVSTVGIVRSFLRERSASTRSAAGHVGAVGRQQVLPPIDARQVFNAMGMLDLHSTVVPPQECINKVRSAQHVLGRIVPFFDLRLAPWTDRKWLPGRKRGTDSSATVLGLSEDALKSISSSSVDPGLPSSETIERLRLAQAAAAVAEKQLVTAFLGALNRLMLSVLATGRLGETHRAAFLALGYVAMVTVIAAERGARSAIEYDILIRKKLNGERRELDDVTAILAERDGVLLIEAESKVMVEVDQAEVKQQNQKQNQKQKNQKAKQEEQEDSDSEYQSESMSLSGMSPSSSSVSMSLSGMSPISSSVSMSLSGMSPSSSQDASSSSDSASAGAGSDPGSIASSSDF